MVLPANRRVGPDRQGTLRHARADSHRVAGIRYVAFPAARSIKHWAPFPNALRATDRPHGLTAEIIAAKVMTAPKIAPPKNPIAAPLRNLASLPASLGFVATSFVLSAFVDEWLSTTQRSPSRRCDADTIISSNVFSNRDVSRSRRNASD
jgi:hypothetical protein